MTIARNSGTVGALAESGRSGNLGAADCLCLAAAPTFAMMALLTGLSGQPDMICSAMRGAFLGGMAPMYVLMSAFHAVPWLKLIRHRRSGGPDPALAAPSGMPPQAEVCRGDDIPDAATPNPTATK
ncbi:hypothetical protein [Rhodopila sp.]|uniref:hypothetical protein n=1 Tax=Rhodopila sp. TaxID=2480087 RepID=UPI003D0E18FE